MGEDLSGSGKLVEERFYDNQHCVVPLGSSPILSSPFTHTRVQSLDGGPPIIMHMYHADIANFNFMIFNVHV